MKEFRVEVKLRNNRLIRYREKMGLSAPKFAKRISLAYGTYWRYESLRLDPVRLNGDWRSTARRIAAFHGLDPSYFWPDALRRVESPIATRELSAEECGALMAPKATAALPSDHLETVECVDLVESMFVYLTPIERAVLNRTYGLDGYEEGSTFEEIGASVSRSSGGLQQILRNALSKLRRALIEHNIAPNAPIVRRSGSMRVTEDLVSSKAPIGT